MKLMRLLRLARMARMARVIRLIPELMILVKGMFVAMRSVVLTLGLLLLIVYFFSLTLRQQTRGFDIGEKYFKSVPYGVLVLLLRGTMPDLADWVFEVQNEDTVSGVILGVFILFATLTVMNMLIGVLCEVVNVVSCVEKEQLLVNYMQGEIQGLWEREIGDINTSLSKPEFQRFVCVSEAAVALHGVGVDPLGLAENIDFVFDHENSELSFADFVELVLELRGTNVATVKHVVDLQKFVQAEITSAADVSSYKLDTLLNVLAPLKYPRPDTMNVAAQGKFAQNAKSAAPFCGNFRKGLGATNKSGILKTRGSTT